jgi:hypothetical protein
MSTPSFPLHRPSKRDPRGRTFLIVAGFAIATGVVALNTMSLDTVQRASQALGFDHSAAIAAAEQRQAAEIARLEGGVDVALREIARLKSRQTSVQTDPAVEDRLVQIDQSLARLKLESGKLLEAQGATSEELSHIRAALANADIGMEQLRVSIDETDLRQRKSAAEADVRIGRLERWTSPDMTGSISAGRARQRPRTPPMN